MSAKVPPLPLEEAQARLLALAPAATVQTVAIKDAIGLYLAAPLTALRTQPAADLSAMDGYAVRADDLAGNWTVIGESAAGHPFTGDIALGHAVRIATGALMPRDADCVILQEDMARDGNAISLTGDLPMPPTKHIRREGLDFRAGAKILPAGARLEPAQVALAISAGHVKLPVVKAPRVAVIDSGDELSAIPGEHAVDRIPASNGAMLLGMVHTLPCEARRLGPVADDLDALARVFAQADDCDVVVTSGGASVGDHDLIRPALEALGAQVDFWRVAIKPGKPLLVATRQRESGTQIFIGLPGNPVSSYVTAYLFLLPLLRRMLGSSSPLPMRFPVRLAAPLKANGGRREFVRGYWDGRTVAAQAIQDSGALAPLAASNVLIDRAARAPGAHTGEEVMVYLLQNGGIA